MPADYEFVKVDGRDVVRIASRGRDVLTNPMINFGTAFTREQREQLGLLGLLPSSVMTIDQQLRRILSQYRNEPSDLAKYIYLTTLQDRNETLFYRLITEHIEEMLPIIYTPTISQAIQDYSHSFHKPRGIYLSINDAEHMEQGLKADGHGPDDVDLIVVTDSEGILGIGDQGVGGVAITTGKLNVYVAAAGIHPHRVLPVVLDTGTDNLDLLSDPAYLGVRHARVRGERYDEFISDFVEVVKTNFPNALLHWEDFGVTNAHRILDRFRDEVCSFNDDIQGTAGVVVAAILSAVLRTGTRLRDQRIVIHGAGTAGVGIADLLVDVMMSEGLSEAEARANFWGLNRHGLLIEGWKMHDFQRPYSRAPEDVRGWQLDTPGYYGLADVVRNVKPTILIGASAQGGSFTKHIIKDMASAVEQPIIMPLSNPTARAEATPADLLKWTEGRALIATGSPFEAVGHGGVKHTIAQANNALIFPGIGLGVITCKAEKVTDSMIAAAAKAIAYAVTDRSAGASLLPDMTQLRSISAQVAVAVCEVAQAEGVAKVESSNWIQRVYEAMWQPVYPEVEVV